MEGVTEEREKLKIRPESKLDRSRLIDNLRIVVLKSVHSSLSTTMNKFFSYSLHFALGSALILAPFHKDFSASFSGGAPISAVLGCVAIFQSCAKIAEPDSKC